MFIVNIYVEVCIFVACYIYITAPYEYIYIYECCSQFALLSCALYQWCKPTDGMESVVRSVKIEVVTKE